VSHAASQRHAGSANGLTQAGHQYFIRSGSPSASSHDNTVTMSFLFGQKGSGKSVKPADLVKATKDALVTISKEKEKNSKTDKVRKRTYTFNC
jgi:hypothetical protein